MNADRLSKLWLIATGAIILLIISGSLIIWARYDKGQVIEIIPPPTPQSQNVVFQDPSPYQKIDINHAEVWLLQALPSIGEVKAQAIFDYRRQNGPFGSIQEITRVPGINLSTFEKIKDLITVSEIH
jgi:competence ComEA-like helix-hairpin-helix protein